MQLSFRRILILLLFVQQFTEADFIIADCDTELHQMIRHALLVEIPTMLDDARDRLANLEADMRLEITGQVSSLWHRNTRKIFSSLIFSSIENYYSNFYAVETVREHSFQYLSSVLNATILMRRRLGSEALEGPFDLSGGFQISCDPHWLPTVESGGGATNTFVDGRSFQYDPEVDRPMNIPEGLNRLNEKNSGVFSLTFNGMSKPFSSVVLLNRHMKDHWTTVPMEFISKDIPIYRANIEELQSLRVTSESKMFPGKVHLGDIVRHHLSAVLLKALAEARAIFEDDTNEMTPLVEDQCVFDSQSGKANNMFIWRCMESLALRYPHIAVRNAINFQYLIVALYLKNVDFSTGFDRPLMNGNTAEYLRRQSWQEADAKLALLYPPAVLSTYKLGDVDFAFERTVGLWRSMLDPLTSNAGGKDPMDVS